MHQSTLHCDFALPAEWEPQSAIMLTWPHGGTDWKPYLRQITNTYLQLADIITRYEDLLVVTPILESTQRMLAEKLSEGQMSRVHLYEMDTNDTWARDHGPISMVSRGRHNSHVIPIHLLDFKFNGWGEKFAWKKDNAINLQLYYQGAFNAALENHQGFVLEGGSIESDGKGTLFTTSQCLLAPHRNQPFTRENIDSQLRNFFHVRNVVWLDHGNLVGDDTDGHIDTIVRVAPHDTLLYVGCDDAEDEQYEDFQALEKQLQKIFTYEGYPYRLLKLPMPDAIYDEGDRLTTDKNSKGDRLPATYANFLFINGAILMPTYGTPDTDSEAIRRMQVAFPEYEIIGINCRSLIIQHGSLHCCTMQFPLFTS